MNRREFLHVAAAAGVAPLLPASNVSAGIASPSAETNPVTRRHFVWTGPNGRASEADLKQKYRDLKAHGLTGVFLGGLDKREVAAIREAGLEAHIWMWTTNRGDQWIRDNHPDWYMVSRSGKSCFDKPPYVDYYRWISPVIPGVQDYLCEKVAEIATAEGVNGVHLDYVRYPDVILPRALWETYKLDQTEELPDYDFCYSEHTRKAFKEAAGRDPMEIKDPAHDQQWLKFRYDSVTHLVKKLVAVAHEHKKEITAAVFPTPSMARMICRQDWASWPLDAATPMIYHSFYNEDVAWIGDAMRENIQSVTFPVIAGLYMPAFKSPDELEAAIRLVHKRGGKGVSLFGGVGEDYWKAFEKAIAD